MKKIRGIFDRNGTLYIRFQDERGKLIRESTNQRSMRVAEQILAKRKSQVAMNAHFPTRQFDRVLWDKLLDKWWKDHGQHTPSGFKYLLPRLRQRFKGLKAREITSDLVQDFLSDLSEDGLSASSVNHYRTIVNSVFNFAIKRKTYDENPVRAVPQIREPPGRDRFTSPEELKKVLAKCEEVGDIELMVFITLAATTGMRKGEILPRKYEDMRLDESVPHAYIGRTKNGEPKKVPLPAMAIQAIRSLPSFGCDEYLFPARPNVRFAGNFKKPHAWDIGKRFRRICGLTKVDNLRIHDLRHFAATTLFLKGIPEAIISKMTGHKSRELRRYEHLSPMLKKQTVDLIAGELGWITDSATDTARKSNRVSSPKSLINGGADGTRTRDLRRDRPAF
jgi:integrase